MGDFFENPRAQLEQQLLNQKWLIENINDDRVIDEKMVTVAPDFSTIRGGYFDIEIEWGKDLSQTIPIPETVPILKSPKDIERLQVPEPTDSLYGRKIEWYYAMKDMVHEYSVNLNGKSLRINVSISGCGGPFSDAFALAGENIFVWMYSEADLVHQLMDKVTTAFINYEKYIRKIIGCSCRGLTMGCDGAEMISKNMFEEFVLPYYKRCYDTFPGVRRFHMCGKIDHLIEILTRQMKITHLDGFGSVTNPNLLAEVMGGKIIMSGGINPTLLLIGETDAIKKECYRYLEIFALCGGYILQDGNNVPPGTRLQNLRAMIDASKEYGAPK